MNPDGDNAPLLRALLRSGNEYRRLIDHSSLLLLVIDEQRRITFACESLEEILGTSPKQVLGRGLEDALPFREKVQVQELLNKLSLMPAYTSLPQEVSLANREGDVLYFDGAITNFLADPDVHGFVIYLHNVTERKRAEEELRRVNFELDSFVYKASHDLRAPLLSILGLIDVARRDFPVQALEYMELIKRSVLRLDKFIIELTEYSRNDRTSVEYQPVDMTQLVNDSIENLRFLTNAASIHFLVSIELSRQVVSAEARLRMLLNNLISNAIKYHDLGKPNPFIRVRVWDSPEANEFSIQVTDNGVGIMEMYQNRVFDMFFRASTLSDGSGLGLYIVKKIVEKLNGRIEMQTRYKDGTSFTITLPGA